MLSHSKGSFLHFIRWFAATLVLLGHTQMYAKLKSGHDAFAWKYVSDHAHSGVIIFFVMSGFVIAHTTDKSADLSCKKYYVDRFSRIYSVLPIALLLTMILDFIGGFLNAGYKDPQLIPQNNYGVRFFVNLLSIQGFQGNRVQFGSNPALWSIGYEFFFYIVFGLMLFWRNIFHSKVLVVSFIISILFILAGIKISLYFLVWLLGYIAFKIQKRVVISSKYFWILLVGLILVNHYVVYKVQFNFEYYNDFCLGLIFSALLIPSTPNIGFFKMHKYFADFSYSLYAFHMPILFFGFYVIYNDCISIKVFSFLIILICILTSWLISKITEKKRYQLRDWLMKFSIKNTVNFKHQKY